MIGYWLARRRTSPYDAATASEPVLAPVAVPVLDTERGRMQ
jgi:hypothetical protein